MVKSIVIDENANSSLSQLLEVVNRDASSKTGLLLGTIDQSKDYILNVVATPVDDSGGGSGGSSTSNSDREWVVNHALQVHDMLIGGMDILGVYCVDFTPALGKQLLVHVFKALNEFEYYKQMKFNSERLLFLVDTSSKSINMKCLDVNSVESGKSSLQPCEIKIQKNLHSKEFFRIDSNFNFNTKFKTPNIKSHNLLKEDFYNALSVEEMFDSQKFVCLINDTLIDENKPFSECLKLISADENDYFATLMENLSKSDNSVSSGGENKHQHSNEQRRKSSTPSGEHQGNLDSIYELTGVSYLIVQVHQSLRVSQIKKLLVYDLMRSLYARVRLLVEDLDARKEIIGDVQLEDPNSTDASAIEESYQTPNRIFIYMNRDDASSRSLIISDYVFPDETDADIAERIKELFDYDIVDTKNDIVYVEDLPPEIKSSQSENDNNIETSTHSGQASSNASGHGGSNLNLSKKDSAASGLNTSDVENKGCVRRTFVYATAAIAALASLAFSYYSFRAANFLNDDSEFS